MPEVTLTIRNQVGLHARPAALFVQQASRFRSEITLRNRSAGSRWVNAKSILGVLTLGVEKDHEIELQVEGQDEAEAAAALTALVRSNFGETAP